MTLYVQTPEGVKTEATPEEIAQIRTDLEVLTSEEIEELVDSASMAPIPVSFSETIPLDNAGRGKSMSRKIVDSALVLVPDLGTAVNEGSCSLTVLFSPGGSLDVSAFETEDEIDDTVSARSYLLFSMLDDTPSLTVRAMSAVDLIAPTFVSAVIENAEPDIIVVTYDQAITTAPSSGDITLASAGGRTITGIDIVGSSINLTVSSAFVEADAPTIAIAADSVGDASDNFADALSTTSITNNVVDSAPVTLIFGDNSGDDVTGAIEVTYMDGPNPSSSYAFNPYCVIAERSPITSGQRSLMKVKNIRTEFGAGKTITDVSVNWPKKNQGGGVDVNIDIHGLLHDFVTAEATANSFATGDDWDNVMALGTGDSTGVLASDSKPDGGSYSWTGGVDMIAFVQQAYDDNVPLNLLFRATDGIAGSYRIMNEPEDTDGTRPFVTITAA